jgi:hypothetical protein
LIFRDLFFCGVSPALTPFPAAKYASGPLHPLNDNHPFGEDYVMAAE